MSTATQIQATSDQIRQINRFSSDTIKKVLAELGLDNSGAQRVIEHGDEFTKAIRTAALASLKNLAISDMFDDEEVESACDYYSGYAPRAIGEQIKWLRKLFPDIGNALEKITESELPKHAEGWFAIPKWQTVAPTYNEAVQKVLDMIKKIRNGKFHNYRECQLGPDHLRQSTRSETMFQKLVDEQKNHDIVVIPAQFGIRHRGRSVRRAREVLLANEFGLGAFAVGIMILTHPDRLMEGWDLWVDCAGDEINDLDSTCRFGSAPVFYFSGDEVKFEAGWIGDVFDDCGAASGFVR